MPRSISSQNDLRHHDLQVEDMHHEDMRNEDLGNADRYGMPPDRNPLPSPPNPQNLAGNAKHYLKKRDIALDVALPAARLLRDIAPIALGAAMEFKKGGKVSGNVFRELMQQHGPQLQEVASLVKNGITEMLEQRKEKKLDPAYQEAQNIKDYQKAAKRQLQFNMVQGFETSRNNGAQAILRLLRQ